MSDTTRPIFAQRLAEARSRAGLSQAQLGVLAGMEPEVASPRVNQYERGVHEPRAEMAKKLAEALNVPAAFLYTEDEMLAKLLLRWNDLSKTQKRDLVKQVEQGFTPVFTDTYEKADRGLRSVHVEAKEVQRRVQARCY